MRYLITGGNGQLGRFFCRVFNKNGSNYIATDADSLDITNLDLITKSISEIQPSVIINCAAYNLIEDAEKNPELAYLINENGVRNLATVCRKNDIFLVHYSTNYVFDGKKGAPYIEIDKTNPINEYGKSKLAGEIAIQEKMQDNFLILRTSWLYGEGTQNFIYKFMNRIKEGKELIGTVDDIATPTSTRTVVDLTIKALDKKLRGTYHTVNSGSASRWDWANEILSLTGKTVEIKKVKVESFNLVAKIPENATLDNSKISKELNTSVPDWKDEMRKFSSEQNYFNFNL